MFTDAQLALAKLAGLAILGALLAAPPAYFLGRWLGESSGRDAALLEVRAQTAEHQRDVERIANSLSAAIAPTMAAAAAQIQAATAERPERVRVVTRMVEAHPEYAAVEMPADLWARYLERIADINRNAPK